jgi:hypothetical protein
VAKHYDAAAGGGCSKVGFGLEAKGALGFVKPERMQLTSCLRAVVQLRHWQKVAGKAGRCRW